MRQTKWIVPLFCIVFLSWVLLKKGCQFMDENNQLRSTESIATTVVEIPEDFPPFYGRFHTDSLYQMEHIIWPLSEQSDGRKWTMEEWVMHKPFDNSSGEFSRDLENFEGIIIETISHEQGWFHMQRTFSRIDKTWYLIKYTVKSIAEH